MKAVVVHGFTPYREAQVEVVDAPIAGPGEVLVALEASDVNYPDILYIEGKYQACPAFPFSPGLAGAGTVIGLGADVSSALRVGDRVLVTPDHGTYAEQIAVAPEHCFPVPNAVPFEIAAALGLVYQTAWFALTERARLKDGETVLVLGATGGIGMASLQLAKALGAGKVIAVSRGSDGCKLARELGADVVIDGTMDDLRTGLRDAIMSATGGNGVDVIIDPVGGDLPIAAMRATAWDGRLVVVGFASGVIPQLPANYLLVKNMAACGLQWTDYRDRRLDDVRDAQASIFQLWLEGRISPRISASLPLEDCAKALDLLNRGEARGKVVLNFNNVKGNA